jgi:competence CoiA-like predicted nuclease
MPFIALNAETRERIDITTIENPRLVLKPGECICQLCEIPMIIKAGQIMRAHFAHVAACPTDYESHPESQEHREAKVFLATHSHEAFAEYTDAKIEYEVPIPEVMRIADLLVTFPMGWRIAHEIQLASITTETLEARTNDYLQAGIDVVWWLGKSANTPANRDWCRQTFGYALSLNIH